MKPLSLRMRLTLVTVILIAVLSVTLTLTNMYNASAIFSQGTATHTQGGTSAGPVEASPSEGAQIDEFNSRGLILMVCIVIAGGVLSYFILGVALRPIKALSEQVSGIGENNLDIRVDDTRAGDEIDTLAAAFNGMLERLDAAFDSQRRFASSAAHELKTPLTTIKANLDVLSIAKDPSKEKYHEVFDAIGKQNERMIHLVDDLFVVSMQKEYSFDAKIALGEMFSELLLEAKNKMAATNITATIEDKSVSLLRCNATMLRRAMINLLENAIKYNRLDGEIHIGLSEENGLMLIKITDTGIGIPPEHKEHIFEPFYRVDSSRSRKTAGSGLGLAIVKDTVVRHGGDIKVSSEDEMGTTFTIGLPIVE